jgi:hypothetical protein
MRIFIVDIINMFFVLPGILIYVSWRKIGRIGWEWIVLGLWVMSIYGALLNDWLLPTFAKDAVHLPAIAHLIIGRIFVLGGMGLFIGLYNSAEKPAISEPRIWRIFRSLTACVALVLFVGFALNEYASSEYGNILGICASVTFVVFIIAQVQISRLRKVNADQVVNWELKQMDGNGDSRANAIVRLAKLADKSILARETIFKAISDPEPKVVVEALQAIKQNLAPMALDVVPKIILLLEDNVSRKIRDSAQDTLKEICKHDFGTDSVRWLSWWEDRISSSSTDTILSSELPDTPVECISNEHGSNDLESQQTSPIEVGQSTVPQKDSTGSSINIHHPPEFVKCPNCFTEGVLPMPGNICPNCKKPL